MLNAIAIDGPSGAGKSTIAKMVAEKLNYTYIDTGAMYRAVALYCINNGIDTSDSSAVASVLKEICIDIKYNEGSQNILLNNVNVSKEIRTQFVADNTSKVASIKAVREKLVLIQRKLAQGSNVVMDGRDIGSVVLPEADTKIYLTASVDVRAKRRINELNRLGRDSDFETVKEEIEKRDYRDMNRAADPLKLADDAVVIDSSYMTAEEVALEIIRLNNKKP